MVFDNKSIIIVGLVIGGLFSLYVKNTELASVIFGGLVGYLSHDVVSSSAIANDGIANGEDIEE